jgi:hypothetical protein
MHVKRTLVPILFMLLLLSIPTHAADDPWAQAQSRELWKSQTWHRLMHYRQGNWPGSWVSQADDARFFLAKDGHTDPRAELQATIEAFSAPADAGNAHAQCRFVARLTWLREQLDLGDLPQPDCAEYREFRTLVQATHAVLVFPSYYLGSPRRCSGTPCCGWIAARQTAARNTCRSR